MLVEIEADPQSISSQQALGFKDTQKTNSNTPARIESQAIGSARFKVQFLSLVLVEIEADPQSISSQQALGFKDTQKTNSNTPARIESQAIGSARFKVQFLSLG